MDKFLLILALFLPLVSGAVVDECPDKEEVVFQAFITTPIGSSARTLDISHAEKVIKAIKDFQSLSPKVTVTKADIVSCASSLPMPKTSVTDTRKDEHLDLALERARMMKKVAGSLSFTTNVGHRVCGLPFNPKDMNLRFIVKESGALFEEKFKEIEKNSDLMKLYHEDGLIIDDSAGTTIEKIKKQYTSPFLARYQPFQGYRVQVFGKVSCATKKSTEPKKPSNKIQ